jgi:hypothetical protein
MQRRVKRGRGKEEENPILNLFLCDFSVAAGDHVDFNPIHYYYTNVFC